MELNLSNEEADLLDRILTQYLPGLRDEIYHTDSREYRASLEKDEEVLKRITERLETLRTQPGGSK